MKVLDNWRRGKFNFTERTMKERTVKYSKIMERLKHDYAIISAQYEVLGVFLFGSQNYQCQTEKSDIDTKVIVIPTIDQMILGQINISKTIEAYDGEITVFDIKSIHDSIKKQNINFLEILFTQYYIINPKYEGLWNRMREHAEEIARLNEYAAVQCLNGVFRNKYKKIFHLVPSNIDSINKYGYDNKALADCWRLFESLKSYIEKKSYLSVMIPSSEIKDKIVQIKKDGSILTVDQVTTIAESLKNQMDELFEMHVSSHEVNVNYDVIKMIDDITINCCRAYIKGRVGIEHWPS